MLPTASSASLRPRWSSARLFCWARLDQPTSRSGRVWSPQTQSVCQSRVEILPRRSFGCDRSGWPLWHLENKTEQLNPQRSAVVRPSDLGVGIDYLCLTFLPLPDGDGVLMIQAHWEQQFSRGTKADRANPTRVGAAQHRQRLLCHGVPHVNRWGCCCEVKEWQKILTTHMIVF